MTKRLTARSLALTFFTIAPTTPALAGSWHTENVDMLPRFPPPVQVPMSLALDDQGNPHISYIRDGNLVHAYKEASLWVTENIETTIESPDNTTTQSSGTSRTVVTTFQSSCQIAATQGLIHVAFMGSNPSGLRYAVKSGGVWSVEMVDGRGSSGTQEISLDLDSTENPHISYGAYPSYHGTFFPSLKYASLQSGAWQIETVDSSKTGKGPTVGQRSVLVMHENTPHIVTGAMMGLLSTLRYISKDPDWFIETITEEGGVVVSMDMDSKNVPHVAWASDNALCLAWRVGPGDWKVEKFDEPAEPVWSQLAMAIDGKNMVHMVHVDDDGLRYFVRRGIGDWEAETVDGAPPTYQLSLTLDAKGHPHVAYLGFDELFPGNWFIKYAYRE